MGKMDGNPVGLISLTCKTTQVPHKKTRLGWGSHTSVVALQRPKETKKRATTFSDPHPAVKLPLESRGWRIRRGEEGLRSTSRRTPGTFG